MIQDFYAVLESKTQLAGDVWGLRFNMKAGETLQFLPGQYLLLTLENNYRQYSISSSNRDSESFELIVEYFPNGLASKFFGALEPGQEARFKGPAGVFTLRETPANKTFLATGTGIAPIKSMIETHLAEARPGKLSLFFGLRTVVDMYLHETFAGLCEQYSDVFQYTLCLSREETLDPSLQKTLRGHIQDAIEQQLGAQLPTDHEYYICGSKNAVEGLKEFVMQKGVPQDMVFFERFTL